MGPSTKTNWPTNHQSQCNLKLNLHHCTTNCRPVLSSERAPYMKNKESNCHSNKCNIWSPAPRGAGHQDELADWLSVIKWLRLRGVSWLVNEVESNILWGSVVSCCCEKPVAGAKDCFLLIVATKQRLVKTLTDRRPVCVMVISKI
jgi:hypothetical protein